MTYPPQPGQWNPGAPPPGPPQPPPGYYPPPGWNPPPPPRNQGGGLKWLLIGVAVLLVIAITIGATLFFTRDGSGAGGNTSTAAPPKASDVASANDTGPVSIITSDPTCPVWTAIHNTLSNVQSNGWGERDQSSGSQSWTPQVRAQYEAVGSAMRSAADQAVGLAKQTPHRVMREMYEQFVAYGRAYADSLASYQPKYDSYALVNVRVDDSIAGVCNAIDRGGIVSRASLVPAASPPVSPPTVGNVTSPEEFVTAPSSSCTAWVTGNLAFLAQITDWERLDSSIPATAWTPEQRRSQESGTTAMAAYATTMESLGRQKGGAFEDFATLGAQYLRVYVAASPSYTPSDSWISPPGLRLNNAITEACKAVTS